MTRWRHRGPIVQASPLPTAVAPEPEMRRQPLTAILYGADEAGDRASAGEDSADVGVGGPFFLPPFLGSLDQIWRQICFGNAVMAYPCSRTDLRAAGQDVRQDFGAVGHRPS